MSNYEEFSPQYPDPFDDQGYDPEDEHPIAKLYRREYNQSLMRLGVIDKLLGSLRPADATIPLFSFAECLQWGLRKNARRSLEQPFDDGA